MLSRPVGVDAEAIETVYRTRYHGFRGALSTVTGDLEAAHDAVQDGFAIALSRRDSFRGGSLEAWIWRIALRRALSGRRAARRVELNGIPDVVDPRLPDPDREPELARAVAALTPRRRLIVFLRYFADLSYAQIGEACGLSEGTVAATLAQAHSQLATALDPEELRR